MTLLLCYHPHRNYSALAREFDSLMLMPADALAVDLKAFEVALAEVAEQVLFVIVLLRPSLLSPVQLLHLLLLLQLLQLLIIIALTPALGGQVLDY